MKSLISPSVLSANFADLSEDLRKVKAAGADMLHLDVMDGMFVPNISFGMPVIASIRGCTDMLLDTHLMIEKPERYISKFASLGSHFITVHCEATDDLRGTLEEIRVLGACPAVSVKPDTPAEEIANVLDIVDMVLVMTVEPGFGGQSFMEKTLPKITYFYDKREKTGLKYRIQVDGGINAKTAALAARAGADTFVAGNAVFKAPDYAEAIRAIRESADSNAKK